MRIRSPATIPHETPSGLSVEEAAVSAGFDADVRRVGVGEGTRQFRSQEVDADADCAVEGMYYLVLLP